MAKKAAAEKKTSNAKKMTMAKTSKVKKMMMGLRATEKKAKKMEAKKTGARKAMGKKISKKKKTVARKETGKKISKAKKRVAQKMVMFRSSDGKDFEVELAVAMQFEAIRSSFDETLFGDQTLTPTVPLPNVDGETLSMVIQYCTQRPDAGEKEQKDSEAFGPWEAKFVNIDEGVLYYLLMAAHFLGINDLLELCCQTVADMVRGKSTAEIRALLHVKDDFTEQEREENRRIERFSEIFG